MPKINLDWEYNGEKPFLELGVNAPYISVLPPTEQFSAAKLDELFGVPAAVYSGLSFDNWVQTSMRTLYKIGNTFGFESFQIPSIGELSSSVVGLWKLPPGTTGQEAITQTVITAIDTAMSAVAIIPVYGWIAKGAWDLGRGIYETVRMFKNDQRQIPLDALTYNPAADQALTRDALAYTSGVDWTPLFLPAVQPNSFTSQLISWGADDDGVNLEGFAIKPTDFADLDGKAILPGIPQLFNNFQLPRFYPTSKAELPGERPLGWPKEPGFCNVSWYSGGQRVPPTGGPNYVDLCKVSGDFLPTLQQLGVNLWSMVRTNGATAFKVDQNRILSSWEDYFAALVDYQTFVSGGGSGNDFQRAWCLRNMMTIGVVNTDTGDVRTWGAAENVPGFADYIRSAASDVPGAFLKNPPAALKYEGFGFEKEWQITYGALVRYMVRDQLRACYDVFLQTITVAYIDDTFPALTGSGAAPMMLQRWQENRAKLLQSSAVRDVELDLIPDNIYRTQVEQSQKQGAWSISAAPDSGTISDVAVPADKPVYPQPPFPGGSRTEEEETWFQRYGIYLLGAAVLGGAGYGAYRYYQRRSNGLYLPR